MKVGATIGARTEPKAEDIITSATKARAKTHFKNNWMYDRTRKHWYSFWCRWNPRGDLLTKFYAERILVPDGKGGTIHRNVYHFTDGRGTIQDGPLCGPWLINEACSKEDGLIHPSRDYLRMYMGPKGAAAWITPVLNLPGPTVTELFLHHDENLRMSVGMVWNEQGDLQSVALIREDARGPFPSAHWSESAAARVVTPDEMLRLIVGTSSVGEGIGNVTLSNLYQDSVSGINFFSTRVAMAHKRRDLVMMMNADNVAVIAPKRKNRDLSLAIVWRLPKCIRTMEVQWMDNVFTKIRILRFDIVPSPPTLPFGMGIDDYEYSPKLSPRSIPSPNTRAQIEHVMPRIPRLPSPELVRGPPDIFSPRQSSPVHADWIDRVPATARPMSPLNLRSPRSSGSDSASSSIDFSRSPESSGISGDVFQFSPDRDTLSERPDATSSRYINLPPSWMSAGAPPAERMRLPVRSVSYTPNIARDSSDSEPDQTLVPPLTARPSLTEPSSSEPGSEPGPSGARFVPIKLQRSNSDPPLMQRSPESGPLRNAESLMDFSKIPQLDSMSAPPVIQIPADPYRESVQRPGTPIRSPDLIEGSNPPEISILKLQEMQRDSPEKIRRDTPPEPPPIDIERAEQHQDSPYPKSMPFGSNIPSLILPPPSQKSVFDFPFADKGQTSRSAIRRPDLKPLENLKLKSPPNSPSQNPPSVPPHINIMTINMKKMKLTDPKKAEKRPPTLGVSTSDSGPGTQRRSQFYPQEAADLILRRVQRSNSEGPRQLIEGFDVPQSSILTKDDSSEEESNQPGIEREYDPLEEARRVSLLEFQRRSSAGAGSSSDAGPSDLHALTMPQPKPDVEAADNASESSNTFSEAGGSIQRLDDDQQSHSSVDTFQELDRDDTSDASETDATFQEQH